MLKTDSVMIAPPTSRAMSMPNIVTIGDQARAQRVVGDHRPLRESLRPRGADVVLAERLEQLLRVIRA